MRNRNLGAALLALTLTVGSCSNSEINAPANHGPTATTALADASSSVDAAALESPQIIITELMPDPAAIADASGEWFEVFNASSAEVDLQNWRVESNADAGFTITTSVRVPSGGYATFANSNNPGFGPSYVYLNTQTGAGIILANSNANEFIRLRDPSGTVVDEIRFAAGTNPDGSPAPQYSVQAGRSREVIDIGLDNTFVGSTNWRVPAGRYGPGDQGTPGTGHYSVIVVGPVTTVTVTPTTSSIILGSTQQFTARAFDADGRQVTSAAFVWSSSNTAIATVSNAGLATGLAPGDVTITAAVGDVTNSASLHVDEPPPSPDLPPIRISEIHYDNFGEDEGEAIEIEGPAGTDLTGWTIVLYNGNGGAPYGVTRTLAGVIPTTCGDRGIVHVTYLPNGIQNGGPDGLALVDAAGKVIEFLSYEGAPFTAVGGPADGMQSTDIGIAESSSTPVGSSLRRTNANTWVVSSPWTFGGCNSGGSRPSVITFSGRAADEVTLPVGFEDQLFGSLYRNGVETPTTFSWSSETPNIASVDQDGVVQALSAGTALIRATASDGTTQTVALVTHTAVASTSAEYGHNTEFGEPTDADPTDDFIVRRAQYTASFNKNRGIPNWVSYNIDATHFGGEDRCDCFTFDPALPASFTRYTTADYTGAGAFHGYGIDRGHLARSFDRTSGSLDNATTFYFTNIIPQAADNNQGPWSAMEIAIGDLARSQNKEVYVITGAAGSKGTVKNEGTITIPTHVWKIAVIMPRSQGLANVDSYNDVEVIAVIMPNEPGIRSVNWETYKTTVDAVEALSGYNLLDLLADEVEVTVESELKSALVLAMQFVTDGAIESEDGEWLIQKLDLAAKHMAKSQKNPSTNQLEQLLRRLDLLVRTSKLTASNAEALGQIVRRVIVSISM